MRRDSAGSPCRARTITPLPWVARVSGRPSGSAAPSPLAEAASAIKPVIPPALWRLEGLHVRACGKAQPFQVVAALQGGDNTAAGCPPCDREDRPGGPGEVLRLQPLLRQGIAVVGVE